MMNQYRMFSVMANRNNEEQRVAQAIAIDLSSSVLLSEDKGPKGFEKFGKKKKDDGKSKEAKKDSEKKEKA